MKVKQRISVEMVRFSATEPNEPVGFTYLRYGATRWTAFQPDGVELPILDTALLIKLETTYQEYMQE